MLNVKTETFHMNGLFHCYLGIKNLSWASENFFCKWEGVIQFQIVIYIYLQNNYEEGVTS